MRLFRIFAVAALPLLGLPTLTGCRRSANIEATVSNHTLATIPLIEVDYPSASFGTENLAPGADYHYRFQIIGNGPTKIIYTDASHQEKRANGPVLQEGQNGPLTVVIAPDGVHWTTPPAKH